MSDVVEGLMPHLVDIRELRPDPNNARTHSRDQIDQLKEAFRQFGFTGVLAYDEHHIRIGHGRTQAATEMWDAGEEVPGPGKRANFPKWHLPAVDVTGLSDEEVRALVLADNKLALNADWDEEKLRSELAALEALDFDISIIGFDQKELDKLQGISGKREAGRMAAEFLIPPFSVLNAREGWWQDRKQEWLALGIRSEIGRGDNLLRYSDTILEPDPEKRAAMQARRAKADAFADPDMLKNLASARGEQGEYAKATRKRSKSEPHDRDLLVKRAHLRGDSDQSVYGSARPTGLGGTLMKSLSSHPRYYEQKTAAEQRLGRKLTNEEFEKEYWVEPDSDVISGTSIFDPVLCELIYRWFSFPGAQIIDPFAGGSVRGIVAAALERRYCGIDLRREQIAANREQWPEVLARLEPDGQESALPPPEWLDGDSLEKLPELEIEADLLFSCPPYGNLEVYSDEPGDISNLPTPEFDRVYAEIVRAAVGRLKPDRFACFVVGDYRDKRTGLYNDLPGKTVRAFAEAGADLYNWGILVTSVGSLAMRAAKAFRTTRKLGKSHQDVLVFVKGDPRRATEALGPVDVSAALEGIELSAEE